MCGSFGFSCFPFILSGLKSVLREGYQLHVLGYTVHHLLEGLDGDWRVATEEDLLPILHIARDEIFSELRQQKEAESGYKSKHALREGREVKSFSTLAILARRISNEALLPLLVGFVRKVVARCADETGEVCIFVRVTLTFFSRPAPHRRAASGRGEVLAIHSRRPIAKRLVIPAVSLGLRAIVTVRGGTGGAQKGASAREFVR